MYNNTNLAENERVPKSRKRIDPNKLIEIPKAKTGNVKIMKLNTANLVSLQPYQRAVDQKKIAMIVSNFDVHKFGVPKVSYRDNVYYVYDGQHRVIGYKTLFGDGVIECEVHFGLSYEDEARLFAQQYDGATKVDTVYKWNALYEAKEDPVFTIVNAVRKSGITLDFSRSKTPNRITCLAQLGKMWAVHGQDDTLTMLSLINKAWPDSPIAFDKRIVMGVDEFFRVYKKKVNADTFVKQMQKINPSVIIVDGDADRVSSMALKYAKIIWMRYNYGLRTNSKLDYEFKG